MAKSGTGLFNRLSYIAEEKSIYAISQETGIPYTSLYNFSRQKSSLPSKWENSLYNMYARETYGRMRLKGYDVATSKSRQYWSPEKIHIWQASEEERIELYTFFNLQKKFPNQKLSMTQALDTSLWEYYRDRISKAIYNRREWQRKHPGKDYPYPEERT